jgi:hypothetical protein
MEDALQADFAKFKEELEVLLKQRSEIKSQIDTLHRDYEKVLILSGHSLKAGSPTKKRDKIALNKKKILEILETEERGLRAVEVFVKLVDEDDEVNKGTINNLLLKLVSDGVLSKDDRKRYSIAIPHAQFQPRTILRKRTKDEED